MKFYKTYINNLKMMKLVFLKKSNRYGGVKSKLKATMNTAGTIQLTRACTDEFFVNGSFAYGRIALAEDQSNSEAIKTFYLVEETNKEAIEKDIDVIKLTIDKENTTRKFNFSDLLPRFKEQFAALPENKKSIYFDVAKKEIEGYNVIEFTAEVAEK
jgi:hypothetical protein